MKKTSKTCKNFVGSAIEWAPCCRKRYLCTTYDDKQFITYSVKQEIVWLEKDSVKFPVPATSLLANKQICIPEFSFARGLSWRIVDNWVAIKEAIEV